MHEPYLLQGGVLPRFFKMNGSSADLPGQIGSSGDILQSACARNELQHKAVLYLQRINTERIIARSQSKGT